uniref:28S ribosomal protein S30, mitochondrial n=1 Tax=Caenorhabditis tropicalis TaxID=1561998 RepID=A0A1I7T4H8_9PELO
MHGLRRTLLIRTTCRGKASTTADVSHPSQDIEPSTTKEDVPLKTANASTVYRPPYYRKPHQHHEPKHMLQEEFPSTGDQTGAGVRLFDYYKTAEIVNSIPSIKEKIDFVSPYERPWTRAEKTWRRDWHPTLMATRKAWGIPPTPAHFDTLDYYKYLTKTRVENGSLDDFYHGLRPPTADLQKSFQSTLNSMEFGDGITFSDDDTQKLLGSLVDDAIGGIAHNVSRLSDYRVAYDVESEAFWVRSGFMFLYNEEEIGKPREVKKRLNNFPKFIGDDRRKLGELAFVHRDKLAAQVRSREPPAPLHSLDSVDAKLPVFEKDYSFEDTLFSPKVYNLWPDQEPLWQCPGYHADSGETHSYGIVNVKSLRPLRERIAHWMGWENEHFLEDSEEAKQMLDDGARSQAIISMFTTLCAQAHTHGFTQYTDVTRPFTSQMILSDGLNFYFAVGQLNTLAINVECDGFVNPRTNFIRIEGPHRLFAHYDEKGEYHSIQEELNVENEVKRKMGNGLSEKVLERVTQMLMKQ